MVFCPEITNPLSQATLYEEPELIVESGVTVPFAMTGLTHDAISEKNTSDQGSYIQ